MPKVGGPQLLIGIVSRIVISYKCCMNLWGKTTPFASALKTNSKVGPTPVSLLYCCKVCTPFPIFRLYFVLHRAAKFVFLSRIKTVLFWLIWYALKSEIKIVIGPKRTSIKRVMKWSLFNSNIMQHNDQCKPLKIEHNRRRRFAEYKNRVSSIYAELLVSF